MIEVRCADIVDAALGASERAIAAVFAAARAAAPCVLLLDQLEALAPPRAAAAAGSEEGSLDRTLSTLLIEMDGLRSGGRDGDARRARVVALATAASREQLDPAILRPGRLDQHIELERPARRARAAILEHYLARVPLAFEPTAGASARSGGGGGGGGDNDLAAAVGRAASRAALVDALADATDGATGAHLRALCHEAATRSMREDVERAAAVYPPHFEAALAARQWRA